MFSFFWPLLDPHPHIFASLLRIPFRLYRRRLGTPPAKSLKPAGPRATRTVRLTLLLRPNPNPNPTNASPRVGAHPLSSSPMGLPAPGPPATSARGRSQVASRSLWLSCSLRATKSRPSASNSTPPPTAAAAVTTLPARESHRYGGGSESVDGEPCVGERGKYLPREYPSHAHGGS